MDLLPQADRGRWVALGLLVAVLGIVYLLVFHLPFVAVHMEHNERLATLTEQLNRFRAATAQRPELEQQLERVRRYQQTNDYFLREATQGQAAAQLTNRLKQVVSANARTENSCQVLSTQPQPVREPEQFERVTVEVRLRCDIEDLLPILHEMENGVPLVFMDDVTIYQQRIRARGGGYRDIYLDVRFKMYGYLRNGNPEQRT